MKSPEKNFLPEHFIKEYKDFLLLFIGQKPFSIFCVYAHVKPWNRCSQHKGKFIKEEAAVAPCWHGTRKLQSQGIWCKTTSERNVVCSWNEKIQSWMRVCACRRESRGKLPKSNTACGFFDVTLSIVWMKKRSFTSFSPHVKH